MATENPSQSRKETDGIRHEPASGHQSAAATPDANEPQTARLMETIFGDENLQEWGLKTTTSILAGLIST